ncbi:hypothetical protein [Caballeronia sp. LZ035]|uniref:hypothetical protein n=1 Tax=Caballeronia sp. LZ035 TaxID=3038568 RepID=UPI002857E187|nr:hypothetical protein [Caballeronia sp. LZ035]MDR5762992.1 hypothetical protein [Caballeronia sp. LZ035]
MTGSLEVKITISEAVTPTLFQALTAVSNPRQRAALLKRLAEDALRGSVAPVLTPTLAVSVNGDESNTNRDTPATRADDSIAFPDRPSARADHPLLKPATSNEEEGQFDYAFLADKLGDF